MSDNNSPVFSLIHPSRGRCQMAIETAKLWAANADNPKQIQYILSLDNDESELTCYKNNFIRTNNLFKEVIFSVSGNKNVVQAANAGAKYATGGIFVLLSDDFSCPENWDSFILENIDIEKEEALAVNDGLQPTTKTILTLPIMTKLLYQHLSYIYYPEYSGIKADDDLAQTCLAMNCLRVNKSKTFQHLHWVNKKKERDETNNRHDNPEGWELGNRIFQQRKSINFGIVK